jgi:hypothetical protein
MSRPRGKGKKGRAVFPITTRFRRASGAIPWFRRHCGSSKGESWRSDSMRKNHPLAPESEAMGVPGRKVVKGLGNLKQLKRIQEQITRIQEEMASRRIEASSGGGMVTAVMNGYGELVDLRIDPQVVDPQDVEMLQDLILAAVREAKRRAQEVLQQEMGRLIPPGLGGYFSGLFG